MLMVLLLVVVAAMAEFEWDQPLLVPPANTRYATPTGAPGQAPNDWRTLFATVLYRLSGTSGERHPA